MRIFTVILCLLTSGLSFADGHIVERLDHFLASTTQSEELFRVFSETFGLPVAWPHESFDGFSSGGVSVGGSILELISYPEREGVTHFSAVAYLPVNHIPAVREQLEANGLVLGANDPHTVTEDGEDITLWETFTIGSLSSPALRVFVCDYKFRNSVAENRADARSELRNRNGGPLGVVGLAEIRIGTRDVEARSKEWSKLQLRRQSENQFVASDGATITLVPAENEEIQGISLRINSLAQAADWLARRDLLGRSSAEVVQIAPEAVQGLSISLVE